MKKLLVAAASFAALAQTFAVSQTVSPTSCHGTTVAGTVRDSTQAFIPGAILTLDGGATIVSGGDGRFRFPCVPSGPHRIAAVTTGFARREVAWTSPRIAELEMVLQPEAVETAVDVSGDDAPATNANATGASQTVSGSRLQSLADDPDDLQRQLQQLAAASGGNPGNVTLSVDGFQGSSTLPPKSSIAYIKINPDQYSAEYREPPFDGARVEVYTKPGQKTYHGALFTTIGSPWENARDPFSTSKAAIGKQRFGFGLGGPVRKTGSDFALTLEHRSIDNFAVVNAFQLDGAGKTLAVNANVATPQRLWLGTARVDWQLGPKNTFIVSYSDKVNHLQNVGVGGTTLAESGFDSDQYEHMARVSNITTASARLMHEARLSLKWDGLTNSPQSSDPQVQVSGAFTGGGATLGAQQQKEFNIEFDDDAIWTPHNHTFKLGTQLMINHEDERLTNGFNGSYVFGDLKSFAAKTPIAFSNVAGTPVVQFVEADNALFVQDDWNVGHGVHIAYGLRYLVQNKPEITNGFTPRLGVMWSPTKKGTWTLHAHAGTFTGRYSPSLYAEVERENGTSRVTSTVYNPVYCGTAGTGCDPFAGTTPIYSRRQFAPKLGTSSWTAQNLGGTRSLPQGWNLSIDFYLGRFWNEARTLNINSPLTNSPYGPRPGAANLNILEVQNSAQGRVNAVFFGVENHSYKRVQFFMGGLHIDLEGTGDNSTSAGPQNSRSDAGELAHRSGQGDWNLFGNGTVTLPRKVQWSTNFNANGGQRFNITTGRDDNGDGNFNDRPQYATPGQVGAVATPYGLLIASGGMGVLPRNIGVLPWSFNVDMNVQRAFVLTHNKKADHQPTLTVNVRSSNVLNHLNVTSVGGVLGSPLFGRAYAADSGRRVEAGARYSF